MESDTEDVPRETAASRYEQLTTDRSPFLDRAERAAELTIPFLFQERTTQIREDYQSLGARCVNNLAAKLLLAMFPPGAPFFKLAVDDFVLESLQGGENDDPTAEIEAALSKIERSVTKRLEAGGYRAPTSSLLKHLIVGGNGLLQVLPNGRLKFRSLRSYVAKRDLDGNLIEVVTKDELAKSALPPNLREMADAAPEKMDKGEDGKSIALFTHARLDKNRWTVYQELGGMMVEGSTSKYPKERLPFLALRFNAVEGEDYGRGYVEEFRGDLASYDSLQESLVGFAAVAAKIIYFVDESGFTSRREIQNARNGEILEGSAKDVTTLQLEKSQDFQVASTVADKIQMRLEQAFLMASSAQRDAERVTAEEIRLIAGELEQTLGGLYSVLAQELQLPLVSLMMAQLQRERKLPALPDDTVVPQIVTGLEGLGRNSELQRLQALMGNLTALGPEAVVEYLKVGAYIQRVSAALSIESDGMIRTETEVQQEREKARQQALAEKAIGPSISASTQAPVAG